MRKFFKEFKERWVAKTPAFWVTMQRVLLAFSVSAIAGLSQKEMMPAWAVEPLKILAFCGVFGTFLAQLTKDNASPSATESKTTTPNNNQPNNTI